MLKKCLIISLFLVLGSFADGMPEMYFDDAGSVFPVETIIKKPMPKRMVVTTIKGKSSYQRLKSKYEAEAAYSEELKERILLLQATIDNKDKAIKNFLFKTPATTEKEVLVNDPFFNIVGFVIGLVIGLVL